MVCADSQPPCIPNWKPVHVKSGAVTDGPAAGALRLGRSAARDAVVRVARVAEDKIKLRNIEDPVISSAKFKNGILLASFLPVR